MDDPEQLGPILDRLLQLLTAGGGTAAVIPDEHAARDGADPFSSVRFCSAELGERPD